MSKSAMVSLLAVAMLSAASMTACWPQHDLSVSESCKQWHQLGKGPGIMTPETNKVIDDDLRAAEPRMHESVARQVRIYIAGDRLDPNRPEDEIYAEIDAVQRLADICGFD